LEGVSESFFIFKYKSVKLTFRYNKLLNFLHLGKVAYNVLLLKNVDLHQHQAITNITKYSIQHRIFPEVVIEANRC